MDYKQKLEYQSNYWYNDGLKKAQIRDLSGAIVSLKRSLQFNRENITARNLLGLVYYGPVSYTHLDVYKRQKYNRSYERSYPWCQKCAGRNECTAEP